MPLKVLRDLQAVADVEISLVTKEIITVLLSARAAKCLTQIEYHLLIFNKNDDVLLIMVCISMCVVSTKQ